MTVATLTVEVLGRRINQARVGASLTQKRLGELIGTDQSAVSRLERGRDIRSLLLAKIAEATGKNLDFFLRPDHSGATAELYRMVEGMGPEARQAVGIMVEFAEDYEFLLGLDDTQPKD